MSSMQLDSVETCLFCQFYALFELIFNYFDLLQGHCLGLWEFYVLKIPDRLSDCNCRGSPKILIAVLEGMCDSSCVEDLQK